MSTFQNDLDEGLAIEEQIRLLIEDKTGFMCHRAPSGVFKGYDLRLDLRSVKDSPYFERRYEVKKDRLAERTKNVAIELTHKGNPSGIVASTADYWVIVVQKAAYFIEVTTLRFEVFCGTYPRVQGGDQMQSIIVLIPLTRLKELARSVCYL